MIREIVARESTTDVRVPVYGGRHTTITVTPAVALLEPNLLVVGIEGDSTPDLVSVYSRRTCDYIEARRVQRILRHLKTLRFAAHLTTIDMIISVMRGIGDAITQVRCQEDFDLSDVELRQIVTDAQAFFPPDQELIAVWEKLLPNDQRRLADHVLNTADKVFSDELLALCRNLPEESDYDTSPQPHTTPAPPKEDVLDHIRR